MFSFLLFHQTEYCRSRLEAGGPKKIANKSSTSKSLLNQLRIPLLVRSHHFPFFLYMHDINCIHMNKSQGVLALPFAQLQPTGVSPRTVSEATVEVHRIRRDLQNETCSNTRRALCMSRTCGATPDELKA